MIYDYDERRPEIASVVFVAPSADVIGSVRLAEESSVWFNAVLRGDNDWIIVGRGSNVQDGCIVHTDPGAPVTIGERVTIGHQVMLHSCTIGDESLVGNGAIVLDGAQIGERCLIAAGALVPPNARIPPESVVMGAPGKVVRAIAAKDLERMRQGCEVYRYKAREYARHLRAQGSGGR